MIIDANGLIDNSVIETDICIIGAGPAGLTIAHELLKTESVRLCLIESGGLTPDPETEELNTLIPVGGDLSSPIETRRRQVGGTANSWNVLTTEAGRGVRYLPLSPIDFERRDWLSYSGWPFSRADLDPFYARAHEVCRIGRFTHGVEDWSVLSAPRWPLDEERVTTTIEQFGHSGVFTDEYLREVGEKSNVKFVLHANVINLQKGESNSTIEGARVACFNGRHHTVNSKVFVLATGAIENARLLLLSNEQQACGLGNQHDLVGRFFMDHHNVFCGDLLPRTPALFEQSALYDLRIVSQSWTMAKLSLSETLLRQEHLLNSAARIEPEPSAALRQAIRFVSEMADCLRRHNAPENMMEGLSALIPQVPKILELGVLTAKEFLDLGGMLPARRGRYGWSTRNAPRHRFSTFNVELQIELSPDPDNRVILGDERDAFGRRLPGVHWRWRNVDLRSMRRTQEILAEAFKSANLGLLRLADLDTAENFLSPVGLHHHLGTTRMHADPTLGVVDPNCRVHGLENLFIAGSSVFPTGGYANPTLTIVALSIRLADHLAKMMRTRTIKID